MKRSRVVCIVILCIVVVIACFGIGKTVADSTTSSVVDPSFEEDSINSGKWSIKYGNAGNKNYQKIESVSYSNSSDVPVNDGKACLRYNFVDGASFYLVQNLSEVAAGTYEVKVDCLGEKSDVCVFLDGMAAGKNRLRNASKWGTSSAKFTVDSDKKDVLVGVLISGDVDGWGCIDNFSMTKTADVIQSDGEQADIYVEKVNNIDDGFIKGVDISSYPSLIESGVKFKDWDKNTIDEQGFFNLLKEAGINYVRIRIWNNPYSSSSIGYGGGNCDVDKAITLGQLAKKAGLNVMLNIQYSDFWADNSNQLAPKDWQKLSIDEKTEKLSTFTKDVMKQFNNMGIDVGMVQIGNETNNGIAGESEWTNMCKLFNAGASAVKESSKDTKVSLHFSNINTDLSLSDYAKKLADASVDYDVFAVSYFPHLSGTLKCLTNSLDTIASTYNKKVMVAETSYAYTSKDGDGQENIVNNDSNMTFNYPISVQGQANAIRNVISAVASVGNNAGIGVCYFEPAWIPVQCAINEEDSYDKDIVKSNFNIWEKYGSGYATNGVEEYNKDIASSVKRGSLVDNQALFDFNGMPLSSLNVFRYVNTGTNKKETFIGLTDAQRKVYQGKIINLPEKVTANFDTGNTKELDVKWEDFSATNVGIHDIKGVANYDGKEIEANCKLTILPKNLIKNPGFENGPTNEWTISGNGVKIAKSSAGEARNGKYSLQFTGESEHSFTVSQSVSGLENGTYIMHAYVQGQKANNKDNYCVIMTSGQRQFKGNAQLSGKGTFTELIIDKIPITNGMLKIEIKGNGSKGSNGSWDDFYLSKSDGSDFDPTKESEINSPLEQKMDTDALNKDDGIMSKVFEQAEKLGKYVKILFNKAKSLWHMIMK